MSLFTPELEASAQSEPPMKTVVLLGAGASADAGVPTMREFIPKFREHLGPSATLDALDLLLGRLTGTFGDDVDLELLLAALDRVRHLDRDLTSAIVAVGPNELDVATLARVDTALRDFLRVECSRPIRPTTVEYLRPLLEFARSNGGTLDIFSLNYDLAVEVACDSHGVRYIDGFAPLWDPAGFSNEGHGEDLLVRLAKLHGSLTWYERPRYSFVEIPVLPEAGHTLKYFDQAPLDPLLLYPAFSKEANRSIYHELTHRFSIALQQGACDLLVSIGYSFRDEATRTLVFEAATQNHDLMILLVDKGAGQIRAKHFHPDLESRCIVVEETAEVALRGNRLLTIARDIKSCGHLRRDAAAMASTDAFAARRASKEVALRYLRLDHISGVRELVEREMRASSLTELSERFHPLPRLDACIGMALWDGKDKSCWWSLVAPLLFWWEEGVQAHGGDWLRSFVLHAPDDLASRGGQVDATTIGRSLDLVTKFISDLDDASELRVRGLAHQMGRLHALMVCLDTRMNEPNIDVEVRALMESYRMAERCGDIAQALAEGEVPIQSDGLMLEWNKGVPLVVPNPRAEDSTKRLKPEPTS
jgi:hypothetical protein